MSDAGLNIVEALRNSFVLNAGKSAIQVGETVVTYQALAEKAECLRLSLEKAGVRRGDLLAIYVLSREEAIVAIIAAMLHGCGYLPLDPVFPVERLEFMLKNAECRWLISDDSGFQPDNLSIFHVTKRELLQNAELPSGKVDTGLGYVIYTSGSTGRPKGVMLPRSVLSQLIAWQNERYRPGETLRTLQFSSLSFDVSFQEIFSTFLLGATLYLIPPEVKQDFRALVEYVDRHEIERMFMPYIALLNFAQWACRLNCFPLSLKEVVTAGEQLVASREIRELFRQCSKARLYNQYGPSESHVVTEFALPDAVDDWRDIPAIGFPIPNAKIYIVDEQLQPVNSGEEGEILIAGQVLAQGYVNNREETQKRFLELPLDGKIQRVYRTGDIAYRDYEGLIYYKGRSDSQIKISGYRVELSEVEVAILALEGIEETAVAAVDTGSGGKSLIAFLVAGHKEGDTIIQPLTEIQASLAKRVPAYMVPRHMVVLPQLLRTPTGKIDRKRMADDWQQQRTSGATTYDSLADGLLDILKRELGMPDLQPHHSLVECGMDSLGANRISAACYDLLQLDIPAYRLYQYRNIEALLKTICNKKENASATVAANPMKFGKGDERRIAIIGAALNVPGARTLDQFWSLLTEGKETITFGESKSVDEVNARGLLEGCTEFDAGFFGIPPVEAEFIDPQQRQLLELSVHALEDAGYSAEAFTGRIGVYCGTGNNSYYLNNVLKAGEKFESFGAFQAMVANEKDYSASRIAYKLNLTGPAVNVQTACSTSLVAVCEAVKALREGDCDIAVAGAASVSFPQQQSHYYQEGGILSEDGHTRTFDVDATGTVFSDGAALVVLKRLDYALADGDNILASIDGIALNNDGADKGSFSAPSIEGQKRVIVNAQQDANIEAVSVGYIEAHGTATPLGDPIEIAALNEAFILSTRKKQFCALGSVKSNFGHLTAAAGVVGLIKSALSVNNGVVPPTINFRQPNPRLNIQQTPFVIADKLRKWPEVVSERIAGVSSFGVGGTNAHVVIRGVDCDAGAGKETSDIAVPVPLCLSAHNSVALKKSIELYKTLIDNNPDIDISLLARAVLQQKTVMHCRFACYAENAEELKQKLVAANEDSFTTVRTEKGVAFLFPGQGAQIHAMGRVLYQRDAEFKLYLDKCALAAQELGVNLLAFMFDGEEDLNRTDNTQLALFSIGYALACVLIDAGIKPVALLGHSIGELVAATIAEVFDLPTAVQVVVWRGKLMADQPSGAMAAVRCVEEKLGSILPLDVVIAAKNAEEACTISGPHASVEKTIGLLQSQGVKCKVLETSHAFHSPMMIPAAEEFERKLRGITFRQPRIKFISCVSGDWITAEQAMDPAYWALQIISPVKFSAGCKQIIAQDNVVAIELGPQRVASGLMSMAALESDVELPIISLLESAGEEAEYTNFVECLGKLWQYGTSISFKTIQGMNTRRQIALPQYPFVRKKYEIELTQPEQSGTFSKNLISVQQSEISIPNPSIKELKINMKTSLVNELKSIFSDLSGLELGAAAEDTNFFELGMDSLLLTQSIMKLKKRFSVSVTFRQLMNECNTFSALADHLERAGAKTADIIPTTAQAGAAVTPVANVFAGQSGDASLQVDSGNGLIALMQQQLQLLSNQMGLLNGSAIRTPGVVQDGTQSGKTSAKAEVRPTKPFGAGTRINVKRTNEITAKQQQHLQELSERYNRKFSASKTFAQENRKQLADPRVVSGFRGTLKEIIYPIVVNRSRGANLWDIDGNQFVDVTCGFGSNFFGNGADFIRSAIIEQLNTGYEIGPQTPLIAEVSTRLCRMTGNERVAFCNTGSEAVLGAIRLARTVTAKEQIVMFENDYHGINDEVIVHRGGDGYSVPAAAGVPEAAVSNTMILDYGEEPSLKYIREHADDIAAIVVEPVQSRKPDLQPKAFLEKLRILCDELEIALIFDEVITGFRIHQRGAQGYYGINADICTYGKVIGGGMPLGVIAGRAKYMDALDGGQWQFGDDSQPEVGVTYFAGTFVRHPPALAAANAVLKKLEAEPHLQDVLNDKTHAMVDDLNSYFVSVGAPMKVVNCGSLFRFVIPQDIAYEEIIYVLLREKGIHIWDARPCFLTLAHTDDDIAQIVSAVKQSVDEMIAMTFFESSLPGLANGDVQRFDASKPPVSGARLGKDPKGNPAWYISDPDKPGKYLMVDAGK